MPGGGVRLLARHQAGALVATAVDFVTVIVMVESGALGPVPATALGAFMGAVTNFWLSRRWIFQVVDLDMGGQVLRYAAVALSSLLLNTAGEHVAVNRLGLHYLVGRVIVSVLVSVGWNFPLHRYFVFGRGSARPTP